MNRWLIAALVALLGLLGVVPLAATAGADPWRFDFPGDFNMTYAQWNQNQNAYSTLYTVPPEQRPASLKTQVDDAWAQQWSDVCDQIWTAITQDHSEVAPLSDHESVCNGNPSSNLWARNVPSGIALQYNAPGAWLQFKENTWLGGHCLFAGHIDFQMDLWTAVDRTIDGGVTSGPAYDTTPTRLLIASISMPHASFYNETCQWPFVPDFNALNTGFTSRPPTDITDKLAPTITQLNHGLHDFATGVNDGLPKDAIYQSSFGLAVNVDATSVNIQLHRDRIPALDRSMAPGAVAGQGPANGYVASFATDQNGSVWERPYANGWQHWINRGRPGSSRSSAPATLAGPSGFVGVFVTAANGRLYQLSKGVWSDLSQPAGVVLVGRPTAVGDAGHLQVFVQASNGHIMERRQTTTGWTWVDHPAPSVPIGHSPVAVANGSDVVLLAVTADGHVRDLHANSGIWSTWHDDGAPAQGADSAPTAASVGGAASLFVRTGSGSLAQLFFGISGAVSQPGWTDRGTGVNGQFVSAPSAVALADGRLRVYATDLLGHVEMVGFEWTTFHTSDGRLFKLQVWSSSDGGRLPATTMVSAPGAVVAPYGYYGAFTVDVRQHLGELYDVVNQRWTDHSMPV